MSIPPVPSVRKLPPRGLFLCVVLATAFPAPAEDGYLSSYYKNGEIHVNVLGTPEEEPLTRGHWDFKLSWSKTSDMLVFFRRLKNDPDVRSAIVYHAGGKLFLYALAD